MPGSHGWIIIYLVENSLSAWRHNSIGCLHHITDFINKFYIPTNLIFSTRLQIFTQLPKERPNFGLNFFTWHNTNNHVFSSWIIGLYWEIQTLSKTNKTEEDNTDLYYDCKKVSTALEQIMKYGVLKTRAVLIWVTTWK